MDHGKHAIPEVPLPLVERHGHRVAVERQAVHAALLQKTPDYPAPPLIAHKPFDICFLVFSGQFVAKLSVSYRKFLPSNVKWVVVLHDANLC